MAVIVTNETFKEEVIDSKTPVLVDFYADWCGPCQMLGRSLETLEMTYGEKIKFVKVNVDECPDLAMEYSVSSIPAVKLFFNGKVENEVIGNSVPDIRVMLADYI